MESTFVLPSGNVLHTFVSVERIDLDGELCLLTAYFDLKERIEAENIIKQKKPATGGKEYAIGAN
jgi:hypothetical protein